MVESELDTAAARRRKEFEDLLGPLDYSPWTLRGVWPRWIDSALEISVEHNLTAYDAACVAAARRHGWTLISTDIDDLVSKGLAMAPDAADYP